MYHRVLLKISGEALSSDSSVICRETVQETVKKIKSVKDMGVQIGIAVGDALKQFAGVIHRFGAVFGHVESVDHHDPQHALLAAVSP